jgi:hypothetical protein
MRIFTGTAGFAAMWLFFFACTSGASSSATTVSTGTGGFGTGGDDAASILDTFCNTIAPPFCDADYTCCTEFGPGFGRLGAYVGADDVTGLKICEQWVSTGYVLGFCTPWYTEPVNIAAYLRDGTIVFDQAQFDTCLALLKSMAAGGVACVEPPFHVLNTTCRSAFRGQIAPGDACPYPGDKWKQLSPESTMPCKDGRCENGKCVPFLKTGEPCSPSVSDNLGNSAAVLCNFPNKEVCWGAPGAGGSGGGGGAGGAEPMGTCRLQGELGDACDPGNPHECKSYHCDTTGKCALPEPMHSACTWAY